MTKLKKLDVQEGKKNELFADHVTHVCKAHDQVILLKTSRASVAQLVRARDSESVGRRFDSV